MRLPGRTILWGEAPDGRREVLPRVWLLVWLVPGLFALAALLLVIEATWLRLATVPGEGEVVQVYAWPGETIFDRGTTNYAPVFIYEATGRTLRASTNMSHPDWNFAPGSRHAIRHFPDGRGDVMLPGPHNWSVAGVIALIGAATALPALLAHRALRRWQARGAPA
jgi:hypothetical protein